ncbi:class I SAM-dependent methyltransferase [Galactobacter caseinivorans]|uniref:Class I SAM-dependent methyltransferase n=1 Tax=Galactobacter caseinivorans TaxID=2676123 RepID=A0A496PJX1_9MICC|nr:class I SAM-dependent methyltransferase [Galactobacter caseinivorans]RKW70786.1 class I SAM-dependent methyltransferase [Galactobacter caseinivorans]
MTHPDPDTRPLPNLPTGAPSLDAAARQELGGAFRRSGAGYHEVRPGYPAWVAEFLVPLKAAPGTAAQQNPGPDAAGLAFGAPVAVDLGAGTGLFTRDLVARAQEVIAVEPSESMRAVLRAQLPGVRAVDGTAECTGLPSDCADVVTVAQAWHWMDPLAASAEVRRILRPGGTLGLVWNQLDVGVPWVHRLARIMHSGDVQRDAEAAATVGPGFGAAQIRQDHWLDTVTPESLMALCHSRSYWLRSSEAVRAKVDTNLRWYLHEHLGFAPGQRLELPYVVLAVRYGVI